MYCISSSLSCNLPGIYSVGSISDVLSRDGSSQMHPTLSLWRQSRAMGPSQSLVDILRLICSEIMGDFSNIESSNHWDHPAYRVGVIGIIADKCWYAWDQADMFYTRLTCFTPGWHVCDRASRCLVESKSIYRNGSAAGSKITWSLLSRSLSFGSSHQLNDSLSPPPPYCYILHTRPL